jgi:galactokinase
MMGTEPNKAGARRSFPLETTLQTIYGAQSDLQLHRYLTAKETFNTIFGSGEVLAFRAPGRVNLIGEHTDYNHGFVLPVALDKDILLFARPRSDRTVRLSNPEAEFPSQSFTISCDIASAPPGDWGNYARGAAQELTRRLGRDLRGLDGLVVGQTPYGVPRQVGLSSSSALTVVFAVALAHINGWHPERMALARLCSEAEWYVGTRGGIMDQFIALLGQRDHALFLDCQPVESGQYQTNHIPLPKDFNLLIADSGVHHQKVVKGAYNRRVAACRAGVGFLRSHFDGITHLRDVQGVPWDDLAERLPEETTVSQIIAQDIDLGDVPGLTPDTPLKVQARCRHVWTENQRVEAAVTALVAGDVATLGRLLNEAHASARDDYEISCPELEILVNAAREVDGVVGARLTGAGLGGCIVAVVHRDAVSDFETHVSKQFQAQVGRPTTIFACQSGPGAGECYLS